MNGFAMPFGATLTHEGVRFALWGPSAGTVSLALEGRDLPGRRAPDGWWTWEVDGVGAGALYQYRIDGQILVPDPASRAQAGGVHGQSRVVDPAAHVWQTQGWTGRPWEEAVLHEVHVGSVTPEGTFDALRERLDHFVDLGVTALELMPVAAFPGRRNWGYDGVLPFAPSETYGTPEALKRLIDAAHAKGLMMLLDAVYNHFGPDGNYLYTYAKPFFNDRKKTPWGDALNFSAPEVRSFFLSNAFYWIEEFRFDGLRLDAVHAIETMQDPEDVPFLTELARHIGEHVEPGRHVHLVLENDDNRASLLGGPRPDPGLFTAQWNDDLHHILHRLVTGETDGYYVDYDAEPGRRLARALTEGFDYQGETSAHRSGARRGEPSGYLPITAFCAFLQNHDQVGNRAHGERISALAPPEAVEAATAIVLLSPQIPLLWMGEEWAASARFPFFCDFEGELAIAVRDGRRREFATFKKFSDSDAPAVIPDPNDPETFAAAVLDWSETTKPPHAARLDLVRSLLSIRRRHVVPLLKSGTCERSAIHEGPAVRVRWDWPAAGLELTANLSPAAARLPPSVGGDRLFAQGADDRDERLEPWGISVRRIGPGDHR